LVRGGAEWDHPPPQQRRAIARPIDQVIKDMDPEAFVLPRIREIADRTRTRVRAIHPNGTERQELTLCLMAAKAELTVEAHKAYLSMFATQWDALEVMRRVGEVDLAPFHAEHARRWSERWLGQANPPPNRTLQEWTNYLTAFGLIQLQPNGRAVLTPEGSAFVDYVRVEPFPRFHIY
jgi:hypothetical protein